MSKHEPVEIEVTTSMLEMLAGWAARLRAPDFPVGEWSAPDRSFPFFSFSDEASEFVRALYDHEWVVLGFDWPTWSHTRDAEMLYGNRDALSSASPQELAKLITFLVRQDRFCEGFLAEAFETGLVSAICERANALRHKDQE